MTDTFPNQVPDPSTDLGGLREAPSGLFPASLAILLDLEGTSRRSGDEIRAAMRLEGQAPEVTEDGHVRGSREALAADALRWADRDPTETSVEDFVGEQLELLRTSRTPFIAQPLLERAAIYWGGPMPPGAGPVFDYMAERGGLTGLARDLGLTELADEIDACASIDHPEARLASFASTMETRYENRGLRGSCTDSHVDANGVRHIQVHAAVYSDALRIDRALNPNAWPAISGGFYANGTEFHPTAGTTWAGGSFEVGCLSEVVAVPGRTMEVDLELNRTLTVGHNELTYWIDRNNWPCPTPRVGENIVEVDSGSLTMQRRPGTSIWDVFMTKNVRLAGGADEFEAYWSALCNLGWEKMLRAMVTSP